MSPEGKLGDLVILVADRNMQAAITGILHRHQSLGIRSIRFDVRRHPETDAGCRTKGVEYLAAFVGQYKHAILMFDHEGCGQEDVAPQELEEQINRSLTAVGWGDNAATIVLVPELDIWVWSNSPNVETVLGWRGRTPGLREWLKTNSYLQEDNPKPARPKEAMEAALRVVRQPRSSSIYEELATKVSLDKCTDDAFGRLKTTLRKWFAEGA
jgi:hypothetical protein